MEKEKSKEPKILPPNGDREAVGKGVNGTAPAIRTASKDEFEKASRKTRAQHAGLFRRLAK